MLAVLAPGQGSQKPGFLTPWLDLPGAQARVRWWSELAGVDLIHLGRDATAQEIRDTSRTQPLLTAAALLAAENLAIEALPAPDEAILVAGHSVGELGAACLAGVFPAEVAVPLAAVRGREMNAACAREETAMAAVLGGDPVEVLTAIDHAGLYPANRNGAGQLVAAGSREGLAALTAAPPARCRIVPLQVAGAFHTPYMRSAERAMAAVVEGIRPNPPTRILLSNADGACVESGATTLRRLVRQVTAPVRWDLCMATMADLGVTALLELPPAGTLIGLAKRTLPGVELLGLNTPDDLKGARELIARHVHHPTHEPSPEFAVVVAASSGSFAPADDLVEGTHIRPGQVIGAIISRQGPVPVAAHCSGALTEWLASPDDPVAPGQPLARIGGSR